MGISADVIQIVKPWASMNRDPLGSEILQVLWAASNPSGPFQPDAQDLVDQINEKFGTSIQASDINPPGSIKTVDDLIKAVTEE
jgi:hypothetical protein